MAIMRPGLPANISPFWLNYFSVSEVVESIELAVDPGARLLVGPNDEAGGHLGVLQDPQEAIFALIRLNRVDDQANSDLDRRSDS